MVEGGGEAELLNSWQLESRAKGLGKRGRRGTSAQAHTSMTHAAHPEVFTDPLGGPQASQVNTVKLNLHMFMKASCAESSQVHPSGQR